MTEPTAPNPATDRAPARDFEFVLRVYWEDTDAGGVVFYANYLKFFERARTEWLRAFGFAQSRLIDEDGVMFIVADTRVRYLRPARLDDLLVVSVRPRLVGRATLVVEQQARRAGELLAAGEIRVGCVDSAEFRPRRIPERVIKAIQPDPKPDPKLLAA